MSHLCDTHCHLFLEDFDQDLDSVVKKAVDSGITKILVPGIDVDSSRQVIELCRRYPGILYPAIGIHPNYSHDVGRKEIDEICALLKNNPGIRAIGEIGLDYYRDWAAPAEQKFVFTEMLKLAVEFQLPICIHIRQAEEDVLQILETWISDLLAAHNPLMAKPGVFHSFDGSARVSEWALSHHFYLGISGTITYKNAENLRESLKNIGLQHIITETDSPYLAPHPNRGKRNEPFNVNYIAGQISKTLEIDVENVKGVSSNNADFLFNWECG